MTVAELIEELKTLDPSLEVLRKDSEWGNRAIAEVHSVKVQTDSEYQWEAFDADEPNKLVILIE